MANEIPAPITVLRSDDLLLVRFHFFGLQLQGPPADGQPAQLVKAPGASIAIIIVEFPPQSIGEEAFFEASSPPIPPPVGEPSPTDTSQIPTFPVRAFLSGPTWLVFQVSTPPPIPYTLAGIFAACVNGTQLVATGRRQPPETLHSLGEYLQMGRLFSRIEAPYHLVLSPDAGTTWRGRAVPAFNAAGTRAALWHVAMQGRQLRAVWATDFQSWPADTHAPSPNNLPFRMSLDSADRYELVRLTTDAGAYAKPVEADPLMLSTLGAWLKVAGKWEPPSHLNITEWKHLMTMGRDHFVRVVRKGYLFPFGHEAALVKITERKIQPVPSGGGRRAAYLRTRMLVIVRQPLREGYDYNGFPFTRVMLKTLITPDIDPPEQSELVSGFNADAFWIRSGGGHVKFQVVARDSVGREIEFVTPLAFISNSKASDAAAVQEIIEGAWEPPPSPKAARPSPKCTLGGQALAFMPEANPNDATLEAKSISLGAKVRSNDTPRFLPMVTEAEVDIPIVKQLVGSAAQWTTITYEETFLNAAPGQFGSGANKNPAEIFARIKSAMPRIAFSPEQGGGLTQPDFSIEGLSRSLGPVPTVDAMMLGDFDPVTIFPDVTLLGGLRLSDIVNQVRFSGAPEKGELLPQLLTTMEGGVPVTRYRWHLLKTITDDPAKPNESRGELRDTGLFLSDIGAEFEIISEVRRPPNSAPSFMSQGRLTQFHIVLLPDTKLVDLAFDSITFTSRSGQKLDVAVVLKQITFLGPLNFVNALMQVVPLDGFADPPYLNIEAKGVGLGYTLAIPAVGIGVFSLQNLSLSAGFYLPFGHEAPNMTLAFCTRENPGQVLVSLFGGGVFFSITLTTNGVQLVEMALEFGAGISLNLGVASGSVTVMGGVYFQKSGDAVLLSAYLRMVGKLSVLGLISVSVEFYLGLNYEPSPIDMLSGDAALKVKVKIAFFSKTVSLKVHREFKGSDPTFRDVLALPDWQAYCNAFGD